MSKKKHVFGSNEERRLYKKLEKTWGEKYNVYHNLPFSNLVTLKGELLDKNLNHFVISEKEQDYLRKTSIDFVICNDKDYPIIAMEFDGMYQGFSSGTKYYSAKENELRKLKLELKLKVAHGSMLPYVVLNSKYFKGIENDIFLSVADGIIGEVISSKERLKIISKGFNPLDYGYTYQEFDYLDNFTKQNYLDNYITEIEVGCDFRFNPIYKKSLDLAAKVKNKGEKYIYLDNRKGVICEVENNEYKVKSEFKLPDINIPGLIFGETLEMEIAKLIALSRLYRELKIKN